MTRDEYRKKLMPTSWIVYPLNAPEPGWEILALLRFESGNVSKRHCYYDNRQTWQARERCVLDESEGTDPTWLTSFDDEDHWTDATVLVGWVRVPPLPEGGNAR